MLLLLTYHVYASEYILSHISIQRYYEWYCCSFMSFPEKTAMMAIAGSIRWSKIENTSKYSSRRYWVPGYTRLQSLVVSFPLLSPAKHTKYENFVMVLCDLLFSPCVSVTTKATTEVLTQSYPARLWHQTALPRCINTTAVVRVGLRNTNTAAVS